MLQLYLLRHAKAEAASPTGRDHDRRLAASGQDDAQRMGVYLERHAIRADRTVLSTAARVQETWAAIAPALSHPPATISEPRLFNASVMDILDVIRAQSDKTQSLMLVGHNPGLEQLVLRLVPHGADDARSEVEIKYPTASLAEMVFAVDRWDQVADGGGDLIRFVRPRDLDSELGPDYI